MFLDLLLNTWPRQAMERHASILQEAIKKGLSDADADARMHSRRCVSRGCCHLTLRSYTPVLLWPWQWPTLRNTHRYCHICLLGIMQSCYASWNCVNWVYPVYCASPCFNSLPLPLLILLSVIRFKHHHHHPTWLLMTVLHLSRPYPAWSCFTVLDLTLPYFIFPYPTWAYFTLPWFNISITIVFWILLDIEQQFSTLWDSRTTCKFCVTVVDHHWVWPTVLNYGILNFNLCMWTTRQMAADHWWSENLRLRTTDIGCLYILLNFY